MVRLECDRTMFVQGGRTPRADVLAGRCAGKACGKRRLSVSREGSKPRYKSLAVLLKDPRRMIREQSYKTF